MRRRLSRASLTLEMDVCHLDEVPSEVGRRVEHRGPITRDFVIL